MPGAPDHQEGEVVAGLFGTPNDPCLPSSDIVSDSRVLREYTQNPATIAMIADCYCHSIVPTYRLR